MRRPTRMALVWAAALALAAAPAAAQQRTPEKTEQAPVDDIAPYALDPFGHPVFGGDPDRGFMVWPPLDGNSFEFGLHATDDGLERGFYYDMPYEEGPLEELYDSPFDQLDDYDEQERTAADENLPRGVFEEEDVDREPPP